MFPPAEDEKPSDRPAEFWQEEAVRGRRDYWRMAWRLGLIFAGLLLAMFFVNRWSGSAVHFSNTRVEQNTAATWRVTGRVLDAHSGRGIPWAQVSDHPAGHPPLFATNADQDGRYELLTIAEPHRLEVRALGYQAAVVSIGRPWYLWSPRGAETLDVRLESE